MRPIRLTGKLKFFPASSNRFFRNSCDRTVKQETNRDGGLILRMPYYELIDSNSELLNCKVCL